MGVNGHWLCFSTSLTWPLQHLDQSISRASSIKQNGRSSFIESISERLMSAQIKRHMTEVATSRSLLELAEKAISHLNYDNATKSQRRKSSRSINMARATVSRKRNEQHQIKAPAHLVLYNHPRSGACTAGGKQIGRHIRCAINLQDSSSWIILTKSV